jgi:hypothetical protein
VKYSELIGTLSGRIYEKTLAKKASNKFKLETRTKRPLVVVKIDVEKGESEFMIRKT